MAGVRSFRRIAIGVVTLTACALSVADDSKEPVVATVNGRKITRSDVEAAYVIRRIPADQQDRFRKSVVNDLVDRALIEEFLDQRKAPVPES
jgi:hypothetical protein